MKKQRRKEAAVPAKEVTETRLEAFLSVIGVGPSGATDQTQEQLRLIKLVTQLEKAMQAQLFERKADEDDKRDFTRLTEVGTQLAVVARTLADLRLNAQEIARRGPSLASLPRVRLHANESMLLWRILPALGAFDARKDGFQLELSASADPMDDVANRRCDLAVALQPDEKIPNMRSAKLGEWSYAPFVPRGAGQDAASLRALRWVEVTTLPEPHTTLEKELGTLTSSGVHCSTFAQAARLVASGRYAAVLPVEAERELAGAAVRVAFRKPLTSRGATVRLVGRIEALEHRESVQAAFEKLADRLSKSGEKR